MPKVSDLFTLQYGHSLELNRLTLSSDPAAINFVSRTVRNNGVSARVLAIPGVEPSPAGTITVALNGEGGAGAAFLQPFRYYSGYHVMVLTPRTPMTELEKLWWVTCITANRFRFGFGRQANKSLAGLDLPSLDNIPAWVHASKLESFEKAGSAVAGEAPPPLACGKWKRFRYDELFDIERGRGPRKGTLTGIGTTPFISSTDRNNGLTGYSSEPARHSGNVITVNRNGSVGEAFYQLEPFSSTEDVHVFKPKFQMSKYVALFLATLIRREKYRFNYGRKWGLARMNESIIRLPTKPDGQPDWAFMESYIKTLPFSASL